MRSSLRLSPTSDSVAFFDVQLTRSPHLFLTLFVVVVVVVFCSRAGDV